MNRTITTGQEAKEEIEEEAQAGYDCIKIYDHLSQAAFETILHTANIYQLPVVGHVPYQVGIDKVLQSSMVSIEHLTGYIDNNSGRFLIPEAQIEKYARKTRDSGIYNCPTLVIWDNLPAEHDIEQLERDPDYQYVSWHIRWLWKKSLAHVYDTTYQDKSRYARHMLDISKKMLLALYYAGCPLVIGTDANFIGVYPGRSALREMELFSEAGIPPIDILKSATTIPAAALRRDHQIGTLTPGKLANMVLLDANPLVDITNIYRISGVFLRGQWMSRENIEKMLAELYLR